jgi:hypothetical protein
MKIELSPTEAAILLDIIQSMQSVKPEAPKVSSWEPKAGEDILVSDDGDDWYNRKFEHFNEDGKPVAKSQKNHSTYSWEYMMPFDRSSIKSSIR